MDPLKYLFEKPALSGRLSRCLILLAEFDLKYMARKIIKGSAITNFCAENPMEGEGSKEDFLDESILNIKLGARKMYFDGVMTQYGNGIGILLIIPYKSHIPVVVKLNFEAINNMEEYQACIVWNGSPTRAEGKGSRGLWRFYSSHSPSPEVVESERGTSKSLPKILKGVDKDF